MSQRKQNLPTKPKQKSTPPDKLLTIQIEDKEDFAEFCLNLLNRGYIAWLTVDGRLPMPGPPPLHMDLSWPECRKFFTQIARRWWEDYTEFNEPKPDPRNMKGRCFLAIERAIETLAKGTPWTWDDPTPPPWNGSPLSRYRLADLMSLEDPDLGVEVCLKYARLWFIRRKFLTPTLLTSHDLALLKRHDRNLYRIACAVLQQLSPRK